MFGLDLSKIVLYLIVALVAVGLIAGGVWHYESIVKENAFLKEEKLKLEDLVKDKENQIKTMKELEKVKEEVIKENQTAIETQNEKIKNLEDSIIADKEGDKAASKFLKDYIKKLQGVYNE